MARGLRRWAVEKPSLGPSDHDPDSGWYMAYLTEDRDHPSDGNGYHSKPKKLTLGTRHLPGRAGRWTALSDSGPNFIFIGNQSTYADTDARRYT